MKKAIKTIVAAILLLNTTCIINNKMSVTQAMEDKNATKTHFYEQMEDITQNVEKLITTMEEETTNNKTKLSKFTGQSIQEKIKQTIDDNNKNILEKMQTLINKAVEDQNTQLATQLNTIRNEQFGAEQVQLLTQLTKSTENKADQQIQSLLAQQDVLKQITLGAGRVMVSLALGVKELQETVNEINQHLFPDTDIKTISQPTLESIKQALNSFSALKALVVKSQEDQTQIEKKLKTIKNTITNLTNQLKPIGASDETRKFQQTDLNLTGDDLEKQINDENEQTTHNNNQ